MQVDHVLDESSSVSSGVAFQTVCASLAEHLASRTYFVGHYLTIADLAVWGQLFSARQWDSIKKLPAHSNIVRWLDLCSMNETVAQITSEALANRPGAKRAVAQADKLERNPKSVGGKDTGGSFDIDLEGASEGNVVTRFPPEPSGYLHIGHAKAALLNQYFARHYKGKLIIRFDDTNPSKEKEEFVENILDDCKTLGLDQDVITYTSDSFPQILEIGTRLIKEGHMYIDDTPMEKMRDERINRIDSGARANTADTNLKLWQDMIEGNEKGLTCAARFRMDMQNDNGALRDPVAFRCNLTPHHRTGTAFKVYPTYDCACPFVDSIEVRTKCCPFPWSCHVLKDNHQTNLSTSRYNLINRGSHMLCALQNIVTAKPSTDGCKT
jgi:glutamyl-tRNA synthetase|tara:strand:+ start:2602 stop:3747 length:1146 start_codon:yes stop_codon:yes gene_type:complete